MRAVVASLLTLVLSVALVGVPAFAGDAPEVNSQYGAPMVVINPGGGDFLEGDVPDGLKIVLNSDGQQAEDIEQMGDTSDPDYDPFDDYDVSGADQIYYKETYQYCCSHSSPMLNIGGDLYGEGGPASNGYEGETSTDWDSVEVLSHSGSATLVGGDPDGGGEFDSEATGSGSVVIRYTATNHGNVYIMDRAVSYTYPNDFFSENYTFTLPTVNTPGEVDPNSPPSTPTVKFYQGGDTSPGSDDDGYGILLSNPVHSVISLNRESEILFGYREVVGSTPFTAAVSRDFDVEYPTVAAGGDLADPETLDEDLDPELEEPGFYVQKWGWEWDDEEEEWVKSVGASHDAGLMMEWNLGSTPGTYTRSMEQFVSSQGTALTASFGASSGIVNAEVDLNFNIVNTRLDPVNNLGFTFTLPPDLKVGTTTNTNGCGGTVTAVLDTITLSGGNVASADDEELQPNCLLTVPVKATSANLYTISSESATDLLPATGSGNLTNGVNTSTYEAGMAPSWTDQAIAPIRTGSVYSDAVIAEGSPTPTYSITAGGLPAGLTLNPTTGAISGTPTTLTEYNFTVTALNSFGSITKTFTGTVTLPIPVVSTPTPMPTPPVSGISAPIYISPEGNVTPVPVFNTANPATQITASTSTGQGSWTIAPDGGVFTAGDASFFGSLGGAPLNSPAVGISPTPSGEGYYLVAADGGVFGFGNATFQGSMGGMPLNAPVKSLGLTCEDNGYYLVAGDGGIFSFGDAEFFGSMGGKALNREMLGIVDACGRNGYWTFAADGGVFSFGDAQFYGSLGSNPPAGGVIGMVSAPDGLGYWLIGADKHAYGFGSVAN